MMAWCGSWAAADGLRHTVHYCRFQDDPIGFADVAEQLTRVGLSWAL